MENALRKLAWASWSTESGSVPLDAIDDLTALQPALASRTLLSDDAGVRFLDPEAMVVRAAEYVLEREQATLMVSPKSCFERLDEIWVKEIGKEDCVSGHVLAALHNSRRIEAFAWAREAVEVPERQKALERTLAVCSAIVKDPEHPLLSTAVTTASRLVHLKEPEVAVLLEEAANTHKPEALYALSGFFFRERKDFWDRPWFWPLVMHLATADAAHKGTLDNVDHVLHGWLKRHGPRAEGA